MVLLCAASVAVAQETSQQRIMDAVMQVYADELKKNPNDFAVLYSRANQYFVNGDYKSALDDVNAALRVTTRASRLLRLPICRKPTGLTHRRRKY